MECNKDEAARALEIAQKKLGAKDFEGARKFAAKAQQLYPPLDGLSQIMVIIDVYQAAERKIGGEMDWYGILQLHDLTADDSLVKKQYRKMALMLHPDKNRVIGAEAAFKHVVEAWGVLSDKFTRSIYDQKRRGFYDQERRAREFREAQNRNYRNPAQNPKNPRRSQPQNRPQSSAPKRKAAPAPPNEFPNFKRPCSLNVSGSGNFGTASVRTADISSQGKSTSFWTVCPFCGMQYEYLRVYENRNLLCRNCQKPFTSVEAVAIPVNYSGVRGFPRPYTPTGFANYASMGMGGFTNEVKVDGSKFGRGGAFMGANVGNSSSATASVETNNITSETVGESKEATNTENISDKFDGSSNSKSGKAAFSGVFETDPSKPSSSCAPSSPKSSSAGKHNLSHNGLDDSTFSHKKRKVDHCPENDLNSVEVNGEQSKKRKEQEKQTLSEDLTVSYKKRKVDHCCDTDLDSVKVEVEQSKKRKEQEKQTFSEFSYSSKQGKAPAKQVSSATKSVKDLLAEKVRRDILRSLSEGKRNAEMVALAAANEKVMAAGRQEEVLGKTSIVAKGQKKLKIEHNDDQNMVKKPRSDKNTFKVVKSEIAEKPELEPQSMTVPDPEFYNFDNDRTENCFEANQVWASYDDENGFPRFYARIVRVVSLNPFRVQMNWLEPKLNKYQTCGGFKVGKVISCETLNMFSHVMKWSKSPKGIFIIFPKKSDVWAVYKNWDSSWEEHTPAEIRQNYVIVEVLTDYTEEFGVSVASLVKVSGFKTVFQRKHVSQPGAEWIVPKAELLRFSHQIPARRLTEEDALNIPEYCWELDPAATPIDILTQ